MIEIRTEKPEDSFVRAADFGLQNEYGVHDEFVALPLHDGALDGISGMVKYLPEFREAEC